MLLYFSICIFVAQTFEVIKLSDIIHVVIIIIITVKRLRTVFSARQIPKNTEQIFEA